MTLFILVVSMLPINNSALAEEDRLPYAVGSSTFFIYDESRPYDRVGGVDVGVRTLITEIWYPVEHQANTIGTSVVIPALQIAIKRITTPVTRPAAFSLFYIFMNLAAMTSGWIIDALRSRFPRNPDNSLTGPWWDLGLVSFQFTYERAVILTSFSVSLGMIPAVFCCLKST